MKVVTGEKMREIDEQAVRTFKIPSVVLMENAGRAVADQAAALVPKGKRITILAGKGGNGGDALVAARYLHNWGYQVKLFLMTSPEQLSGDPKANADMVVALGLDFDVIQERQLAKLKVNFAASELIIDGLLGTGVSGRVSSSVEEVITLVNESACPVLSIDIPSGLDAKSGRPMGVCVQADYTVTFGAPKLGMVQYPAIPFVGQLIIADIGLPPSTF